jgi:ATP-binding cassette subfamily F protein uup
LFTDEKVPDNDTKKNKRTRKNINNKIEDREERWFELSAKIEG